MKILSVEDQEAIRQGLVILLESQGFEVVTAVHGEEALQKLEDGFIPDVILADHNMPVMDGIELIKALKKRPGYAVFPVVFLSARSESENIMAALRYGAIDYITKPYDPEDLLKRIQRAFKIGQQLQLAESLQGQYENLHKQRAQITALPFIEMHLKYMTEAEVLARFFASAFDKAIQSQVTVGLIEGLSNAIIHGNCGISSEIREQKDGYLLLQQELKKRQEKPEYKDRKVIFRTTTTSEMIEFEISDEGDGFDVSNIPDPRDPENVIKKSGRGILLMQLYFDSVEYNQKGNFLKLKKLFST